MNLNGKKSLWDEKKPPQQQQTRGWNDDKQITEAQRIKEESSDYRYFPEPDLPPLRFGMNVPKSKQNKIIDTQLIWADIPELPFNKKKRFIEMYNFSSEDAQILTEEKNLAHYTEKVITELKEWVSTREDAKDDPEEETWKKHKKELIKLTGGWLTSKLFKLLNGKSITIKECKITPENFAELISYIYENKINSTVAQNVLEQMFEKGSDPSQLIKEQGLEQVSDVNELEKIILKVIKENPEEVKKYKDGKISLLQYLIGQVMKETKGKANPKVVADLLKKKLK